MEKSLFKVVSKCCGSVTNDKNGSVTLNFFLAILGAPEKSRTPNLQIRSLALYPIELRALLSFPYSYSLKNYNLLLITKFNSLTNQI